MFAADRGCCAEEDSSRTATSPRRIDETLHGLPRQQTTLARSVRIDGFGFWSGQDVTLEFRPAAPNSGIVFIRQDVTPTVTIPARVGQRIDAARRTTLSRQGVTVEMVEHVLAALAGLRIDNCEIWTDAAEMPGADGSSLPFASAFHDAGRAIQDVPRQYLVVESPIRIGDDDCWIEARPSPDASTTLEYRLDYGPNHVIAKDTVQVTLTPSVFLEQLAPARTFLTRPEAEWLQAQGLARRVTTRDVLVFDDEGVVENRLRMNNECATHKILDMVGDLSLAGCDLIGSFTAYRTGHRLNADMVKNLLSEFQIIDQRKSKGAA